MSITNKNFLRRRKRLRYSLRQKAAGKVRLSVHRTGKHMYAQLIDDNSSATLASASTLDKSINLKSGSSVDAAKKVGALIAQKAKAANIDNIVFDRGGYIFHGRVKAVAEAAREAGLKF
jgi:large subunit ribosomal protein L18